MKQSGTETFNRAKLLNVGYVHAIKEGFDCFAFHDVDLLPNNDRCSYSCGGKPYHQSFAVDTLRGSEDKISFGTYPMVVV